MKKKFWCEKKYWGWKQNWYELCKSFLHHSYIQCSFVNVDFTEIKLKNEMIEKVKLKWSKLNFATSASFPPFSEIFRVVKLSSPPFVWTSKKSSLFPETMRTGWWKKNSICKQRPPDSSSFCVNANIRPLAATSHPKWIPFSSIKPKKRNSNFLIKFMP